MKKSTASFCVMNMEEKHELEREKKNGEKKRVVEGEIRWARWFCHHVQGHAARARPGGWNASDPPGDLYRFPFRNCTSFGTPQSQKWLINHFP